MTSPIIPSIDLLNNRTVQLVGGDENSLEVDAGDPLPLARKFAVVGEIAVVDLDAAMNKKTNNESLIRSLLKEGFDLRVGGGIRSVERALEWLNWGAVKVVLGTAAKPDILRQLPRDRVVAALDCVNGEVVVDGWKTKTGLDVFDQIQQLRDLVGGFLVTFVEREGRLGGVDVDLCRRLREACGPRCELTVAGGVTTVDDMRALDGLGIRAQVGMALYTGRLLLGDAFGAPLKSDRADGLFPTVVVDELGASLGLVYSSRESLSLAITEQKGVYWSRSRGQLWRKGETSGATQDLVRVELDCDRDAIRVTVRQRPGTGFCHRPDRRDCFGPSSGGAGIGALMRTLQQRVVEAEAAGPESPSYTHRLLRDSALLRGKLLEEAGELAEAQTADEVAHECADLLYFTLVAAAKANVSLDTIERILDQRALKVSRRKGDAKPPPSAGSGGHPGQQKKREPASASTSNGSVEPAKKRKLNSGKQTDDGGDDITTFSGLNRVPIGSIESLASDAVDEFASKIANEIISDVRSEGGPAIRRHAERLGDIGSGDPLVWGRDRLKQAFDSLPAAEQGALQRGAERVRRFALAQRRCLSDLNVPLEGGWRGGHSCAPVQAAGCYAPGGRYPLPSSVIMTCVTARAANVQSVWVASPRPAVATAAAAYVSGADGLLAVGGAQAIAALAYGSPEHGIPPSDLVCGPGNRFVTAAKARVAAVGACRIDLVAGPSEVLVVADRTADPATVAADLLAQAEHDPGARCILICLGADAASVADAIDRQLVAQLASLSTRDIAGQALRNSFCVLCPSLDECVNACDRVAPEHLELHVANAEQLAGRVQHYGGLFIGGGAAEVFGDYCVGPNHVLPTGSTARHSGGLCVLSFLRVRTFLEQPGGTSRSAAASSDLLASAECQAVVRDCAVLAGMEGLYGHQAAANQRVRSIPAASDSASKALLVAEQLVRPDLKNMARYTPVKPLEVLAKELGFQSAADLAKLDANENLYGPVDASLRAIAGTTNARRRPAAHSPNYHIYPDPLQIRLREALVSTFAIAGGVDWVIGGAGADDILDMLMRATREPGMAGSVCICTPTFGMYDFLARVSQLHVVEAPRRPAPDFSVDVALTARTVRDHGCSILFLCSPNNPTGTFMDVADVRSLCLQLPQCLVVVDEAYIEFVDEAGGSQHSCIPLVPEHGNLMVLRTFSKWAALAGVRCGWAVACPPLIDAMIAVKQPYNVGVPAEVAAVAALAERPTILNGSVRKMREERDRIVKLLEQRAWLHPYPSKSNFVLCLVQGGRMPAWFIAQELRKRGGRPEDTERLRLALDELDATYERTDQPSPPPLLLGVRPDCLLLDMDGVLADVHRSYRETIKRTCAHFGVPAVTDEQISALKATGRFNNDWDLSLELVVSGGGVDKEAAAAAVPSLARVTSVFESIYNDSSVDATDGLWRSESLVPAVETLSSLAARTRISIVTGRPRRDAERFLNKFKVAQYFQSLVCMEDTARGKPDPSPLHLGLKQLQGSVGMYVGDTTADVQASSRARMLCVGVVPQAAGNKEEERTRLLRAGAVEVIDGSNGLVELLEYFKD